MALFAPPTGTDKIDELFGLGTMVDRCRRAVASAVDAVVSFRNAYNKQNPPLSSWCHTQSAIDVLYDLFKDEEETKSKNWRDVCKAHNMPQVVAAVTSALLPAQIVAVKRYAQLKINVATAETELNRAINARDQVQLLEKKVKQNQIEIDKFRKQAEAAPPPPKIEPRKERDAAILEAVKAAPIAHIPITTGQHHGGVVPTTLVNALSHVPESLPDIIEDNVVSTQRGMRRVRFGHKDAQVDNVYIVCQTIVERISNALVPSLFCEGVPSAVSSAASLQSIAIQHANMICEDAKRPHTAKSGGLGYDAAMDLGESWQAIYATCAITHTISMRITMWRAAPVLEQEETRSNWIGICAMALLGLGMMTRNTIAAVIGIPVAVLTANASLKDITNGVHNALFPRSKQVVPNDIGHIINNYDCIANAEAAGTLFAEVPVPFQMRPSTTGRADPARCTFSQRLSDLSTGPTAVVLGQPLLAMSGPFGPACPNVPARACSSPDLSLSAPTFTPPLATSIHCSDQCLAESSFLVVNPTYRSPTLTATLGSFWSTLKTSAAAKSSSLGTSITGWVASLHPKEAISSQLKRASAMVDRALETSGQFLLKARNSRSGAASTIPTQSPAQNMSTTVTSPLVLTKIKLGSDRGAALSHSASPESGIIAIGSSSTLTHQTIRSENGTPLDVEHLATSGPSSSTVHGWTPPIASSPWDSPSGSSDVLEPPNMSSSISASSLTTSVPVAEVVSPSFGVHSSSQVSPTQLSLIPLPLPPLSPPDSSDAAEFQE